MLNDFQPYLQPLSPTLIPEKQATSQKQISFWMRWRNHRTKCHFWTRERVFELDNVSFELSFKLRCDSTCGFFFLGTLGLINQGWLVCVYIYIYIKYYCTYPGTFCVTDQLRHLKKNPWAKHYWPINFLFQPHLFFTFLHCGLQLFEETNKTSGN